MAAAGKLNRAHIVKAYVGQTRSVCIVWQLLRDSCFIRDRMAVGRKRVRVLTLVMGTVSCGRLLLASQVHSLCSPAIHPQEQQAHAISCVLIDFTRLRGKYCPIGIRQWKLTVSKSASGWQKVAASGGRIRKVLIVKHYLFGCV